MKVIILAAGQGTRLRPLTDECPKCMVNVSGKSIIDRQIDTMVECGIRQEDIYIVAGYRADTLKEHLSSRGVNIIVNSEYESTNMVCSLMSARHILEDENDILVSYGDIIYEKAVLKKILSNEEELQVVVDDGWKTYWEQRCDNPLDDAETLIYDKDDNLLEIGQKTDDISKVQSQYIGLMRYREEGIRKVLEICAEAEERSSTGKALWRTTRDYKKMYMTDMLQGLIDEGNKLKAVHINRGWFEVDCARDLEVAESAYNLFADGFFECSNSH